MLLRRIAWSFSRFASSVSEPSAIHSRGISATPKACDLREFLDLTIKDGKPAAVGRDWKASELRLKNWDDLHKLWHVLLKERLMLKSEQLRFKSQGQMMPNPRRITKCRKSMNRIKQVLSERAHAQEDPVRKKQMLQMINAV